MQEGQISLDSVASHFEGLVGQARALAEISERTVDSVIGYADADKVPAGELPGETATTVIGARLARAAERLEHALDAVQQQLCRLRDSSGLDAPRPAETAGRALRVR